MNVLGALNRVKHNTFKIPSDDANVTKTSSLAAIWHVSVQQKFYLAVMGLILCINLSACMSGDQASVVNDGLVFCSEGNPDTLNPQFATSGISMDAGAHTMFNQLIEFEPGKSTLRPSLAESWSISEDGLVYTIKLRPDVHFHETPYFTPSRTLNADDVLFSINRQRLQSHPYHAVSSRNYPYFDAMGLKQLIVDVNKLDDLTVEIHLARAESPFLATLAMEFMSILSAEYAAFRDQQDKQELFDLYPIGTGPFVFKRHVQDAFIRYYRHEKYFRGPEKIKNLVFAITPEPSLRYTRLTAGECDVMANPLPIYLEQLRQNKNLTVKGLTGLNVAYWAFNTKKPPLDNPVVRRALNHAVNRQAIIQVVYNDSAQRAESPLPPAIWSHDTSVKRYDYNPIYARKLLNDANIKNLEIDIWLSPTQRPYNPNASKTAELIVDNLEQIGVKARVISYQWSTFLHSVNRGLHQTALLGWFADNGDPDSFLTPLLSCEAARTGSNRAFWCNKEFDKLINEARLTHDQEKREALYVKAQEIFKEEAPWLTIAHATQYIVYGNHVKNLQQSLVGGVYFSDVYLERN